MSLTVENWLNSQMKTAIRKYRVYRKYFMRGRKPEDWNHVNIIRNIASKMVAAVKEQYYVKLGQKLSRYQANAKPTGQHSTEF